MIPLVIDDVQLRALREYAEAHKINSDEMKLMVEGKAAFVGDRPGHSLDMPVGFRVVYSIEEHPQEDGKTAWIRHMSMSQARPDRDPNIIALQMVATALGFPNLDECMVRHNEMDGQPEVLCLY
jgi:hypothetical protein